MNVELLPAGSIRSVDVVIPLYNTKDFILEAIQSILDQTYPVNAVLVVDDGSKDGSPELVEQSFADDPRVRLLRKPHSGLSDTRNHGCRQATAEYIAFLDSDDVWEPHKLEMQMALFATSPLRPGVVYCNYSAMTADGSPLETERIIAPTLRGQIFDPLLSGNYISGSASAVVLKRELLKQVGLFDTSLKFAEDWDFWLRLAHATTFDFADQPLVRLRRHPNQMQTGHTLTRLIRQVEAQIVIWGKWQEAVARNVNAQVVIKENLNCLTTASDIAPWRLFACLREIEAMYARVRPYTFATRLYGPPFLRPLRLCITMLTYPIKRHIRKLAIKTGFRPLQFLRTARAFFTAAR
ncbi:MAG: glycosyltransferase [Ferrovibrio sp.]|uniref:glycosyltransferase n=1 Tax=Ferrovibrio sp. TaxID=1917215 RepID=UPI00391B7083